jgi:hypothetical protein
MVNECKCGCKWINVGERLPEIGEPVLALCKGFLPHVSKLTAEEEWYDYYEKYPMIITHWMPLPDPPGECMCECTGARDAHNCGNCKHWEDGPSEWRKCTCEEKYEEGKLLYKAYVVSTSNHSCRWWERKECGLFSLHDGILYFGIDGEDVTLWTYSRLVPSQSLVDWLNILWERR